MWIFLKEVLYTFKTMRLMSPQELKQSFPLSASLSSFILSARETICRILRGEDPRALAIVGPCSIHNVEEALLYARAFQKMQTALSSSLFMVMRAYVEKPRTLWGWKGLILDPYLDGSYNIFHGLSLTRFFLLELASLHIPAATEFLTPQLAPYFEDLISWGSIGARTSASQIHRQFASSLEMPVGFKNGIHGEIESAASGMLVAKHPQLFVHIDQEGHTSLEQGEGNPHPHLILRGAQNATNYQEQQIREATSLLTSWNLPSRVIIDCSHGNAQGDYLKQIDVLQALQQSLFEKNSSIAGFMLESYLRPGSQKLLFETGASFSDSSTLEEGVSITDGCLDVSTTEEVLSSVASLRSMNLTHS